MSECPKCGGKMNTTNTRHTGSFLDRRRKCECGHVDRALVKPEEVVRVIPVRKRTTMGSN